MTIPPIVGEEAAAITESHEETKMTRTDKWEWGMLCFIAIAALLAGFFLT